MSYDPLNVEPKELMSDSLHELLNEEQQAQAYEIFILISLALNDGSLVTGNLLGIELIGGLKIDFKLLTRNAFEFINKILIEKKEINSIYLNYSDDVVELQGKHEISCLKIVEMDYENRACILAIDLLKTEL